MMACTISIKTNVSDLTAGSDINFLITTFYGELYLSTRATSSENIKQHPEYIGLVWMACTDFPFN